MKTSIATFFEGPRPHWALGNRLYRHQRKHWTGDLHSEAQLLHMGAGADSTALWQESEKRPQCLDWAYKVLIRWGRYPQGCSLPGFSDLRSWGVREECRGKLLAPATAGTSPSPSPWMLGEAFWSRSAHDAEAGSRQVGRVHACGCEGGERVRLCPCSRENCLAWPGEEGEGYTET